MTDDSGFVVLDVGGRAIRAAANHPLFVHGRGWTAAGELRTGDQLHTPGGTWATVQSVRIEGCFVPRPFLGFAAGTPILTADGTTPIDQLRPGDLLESAPDDPDTDPEDEPPPWRWN